MSPSRMIRRRSGLYVPERSFPVIPTSAAGRIISTVQASTASTRTFPDQSGLTKNKGDLLIACVWDYGASLNNAFHAWGGSYTMFCNFGSSGFMVCSCAWKVCDGTETGTFTVGQFGTVGGHATMMLMSIPGASIQAAPEVSAYATGTTAAADPAALSPSYGSKKALWISFVGSGSNSATGTFDAPSAAPTNYGSSYLTGPTATPNASGEANTGVAFRQLEAATEDVGPWTVDVALARNSAFLMAIRPG